MQHAPSLHPQTCPHRSCRTSSASAAVRLRVVDNLTVRKSVVHRLVHITPAAFAVPPVLVAVGAGVDARVELLPPVHVTRQLPLRVASGSGSLMISPRQMPPVSSVHRISVSP